MSPRLRKLASQITDSTPATQTPQTTTQAASATPATAATTSAAIALIAAPPSTANIPPPPTGYDPTDGSNYRGIQPRKAELVALPAALKDLGRFTTYAQVLGTTAPPLAQVQAIFDVANEWSTMRNASTAWDAYCRDQEGMAWVSVHALMDRLRPSFSLAVAADPGLGTGFTGLSSLLAVKKVIANKAASTKRLNKKAVAEGKPPVHGLVGKKRKKAADKAAGAAATAVSTAPPPTPLATAAPEVVVPASPSPAPAPIAAPQAAELSVPAASVTALNGASHS